MLLLIKHMLPFISSIKIIQLMTTVIVQISVKSIVEYWMDYHSLSGSNDRLFLSVPDSGLSSAVSDSGRSSAAVAGICVGVFLFAAAALIAGLIYRRRRRYTRAPQNVSITYS